MKSQSKFVQISYLKMCTKPEQIVREKEVKISFLMLILEQYKSAYVNVP